MIVAGLSKNVVNDDACLVCFLGFEPWKITHASDNFGKLYDFAVELIKRYTKRLYRLKTAN